jgi:hypothetical protein
VVAEPGISRLIAEAVHFLAGDRRRRVTEVDQQAQAREITDRLALRRREHGAARGRHRSDPAQLFAPFTTTLFTPAA